MKNIATAAVLAVIASFSGAASAQQFVDYAEVLQVEPVMAQSRAQQVCSDELVGYRNNGSQSGNTAVGTVVGGLIGGLAGNQVGNGRGRTLAIAAGAVGGAMVGGQYVNANSGYQGQGQGQPVYSRVCHQAAGYQQQQIAGYRVTYGYNGRQFTSMMARDPGARIRVGVSVQPQ